MAFGLFLKGMEYVRLVVYLSHHQLAPKTKYSDAWNQIREHKLAIHIKNQRMVTPVNATCVGLMTSMNSFIRY